MIGYIQGTIVSKAEKSAIVMTAGGVGYQVYLSETSLISMANGDKKNFFIETIVREDAIILFGFEKSEEQTLFNLLTSVNKVGPKLAMAALSFTKPVELVRAIIQNDVKAVTLIPGIGKKTAEKVIIDLKDKVTDLYFEESVTVTDTDNSLGQVMEAEAGLTALGYNKFAINSVISKILDKKDKKAEQIVREALKIINEQK